MNEILHLVIMSASSVLSLFILAKLLGKRQVAQLEFMDYAIGISIGSISAEMATDINDKPIYYYLISLSIFFLFDLFINFLGRKTPFLKRFLKGKPIIIIYEGKILYENLKRSKLSVNDLLSLSRIKGYFNLLDIEYAIFENNGSLSILPKSSQKPIVAQDIQLKLEQTTLPNYLIVDGRISYSSLNELNKNVEWLFDKLQVKNKKDLKNIILAVYDEQNDEVVANYKND